MQETDFHAAADALYAQIEARVDADYDAVDYDTVAGVMTLEGPAGKVIVSRQPPLSEIWVAARSGGYHFRHEAGVWVDTRSAMPLAERLENLLVAIQGP